jgi:hypothetical protein
LTAASGYTLLSSNSQVEVRSAGTLSQTAATSLSQSSGTATLSATTQFKIQTPGNFIFEGNSAASPGYIMFSAVANSGSGAGGSISLQSGKSNTNYIGSNIVLFGANAGTTTSGGVSIVGGSHTSGTGTGGSITLSAGGASSGTPGDTIVKLSSSTGIADASTGSFLVQANTDNVLSIAGGATVLSASGDLTLTSTDEVKLFPATAGSLQVLDKTAGNVVLSVAGNSNKLSLGVTASSTTEVTGNTLSLKSLSGTSVESGLGIHGSLANGLATISGVQTSAVDISGKFIVIIDNGATDSTLVVGGVTYPVFYVDCTANHVYFVFNRKYAVSYDGVIVTNVGYGSLSSGQLASGEAVIIPNYGSGAFYCF